MKLTFSARLNDDGSWRGLAWADKKINPILIVGHRTGEYFTNRKEAIQAVKKQAKQII